MKPDLFENVDIVHGTSPRTVVADISETAEDFKGHFGILPMNSLLSLVKQAQQHEARCSISMAISKSIAPGKTVSVDLETGEVFFQNGANYEEIGHIHLSESNFPQDRMSFDALRMISEENAPPEGIAFDKMIAEGLPHEDPYVVIDEAAMYSDTETHKTTIVARSIIPEDSPFHGPEIKGNLEDIGFLCEFVAQTGALFLNDPEGKNIVTLANLDFTALSNVDTEAGMQIECYSLGTPEQSEDNPRAKTCKFALVVIADEGKHLCGFAEVTGISMPRKAHERIMRRMAQMEKRAKQE